MRITRCLGAVLLALGLFPLASASEVRAESSGPILRSWIYTPPIPVAGTDRQRHLVYEMFLRNPTRRRVRVDRLVVQDAQDLSALGQWRGRALGRLMFRIGEELTQSRTLRPNDQGLILIDVRMAMDRTIPSELQHRFTLTLTGNGDTRRVRRNATSVPVSDLAPTTLRPPLAGDDLLTIGCCGPPFAHRLGAVATTEGVVFAQRYAIDVVQLGEGITTYEGDPSDNESYFVYGDEALAVADAEVVATRNDMVENTPGSRPSGITLNDLAGNFVTLDLGDGRFAVYAHLQPGSVTVEPGDRVVAGEVLGLIGNSGNSTEPHLHFHFMNGTGGDSTLESDGIPYVFDSFQLTERLNYRVSPQTREPADPPADRAGEYTLTGDIVSFPPTD